MTPHILTNHLADSLKKAIGSAIHQFPAATPYPHAIGDSLGGKSINDFEEAVKQVPLRRHIETFYSQCDAALYPDTYTDDETLGALCIAPRRPDVLRAASILSGRCCATSLTIIHRLCAGDQIGVHNDANEHGEFLRLCWMLGQPTFSGGDLCLHADAESPPVKRIRHRRDRWFLFPLGGKAYHSVSPVYDAETGSGRWTVIFTWGTPRREFSLMPDENRHRS